MPCIMTPSGQRCRTIIAPRGSASPSMDPTSSPPGPVFWVRSWVRPACSSIPSTGPWSTASWLGDPPPSPITETGWQLVLPPSAASALANYEPSGSATSSSISTAPMACPVATESCPPHRQTEKRLGAQRALPRRRPLSQLRPRPRPPAPTLAQSSRHHTQHSLLFAPRGAVQVVPAAEVFQGYHETSNFFNLFLQCT